MRDKSLDFPHFIRYNYGIKSYEQIKSKAKNRSKIRIFAGNYVCPSDHANNLIW